MNENLNRQRADERIRELTNLLNRYRNEYYNNNEPSVSDEVYDCLFEELLKLEQENGICMENSPTQTVGYPPSKKFGELTKHEIPLLSLEKTKEINTLCDFIGVHQIMLMLKLDGLTIKLTYDAGALTEAATRGDGFEGEIVTHNAKNIGGIPLQIPYKDRLVVTGEAFIRPSVFKVLQKTVFDSNGRPYKNGRNLAAGSVRKQDTDTCKERQVIFMPFKVLEGFDEETLKSKKLARLSGLGFEPCKYFLNNCKMSVPGLEEGILRLKQFAEKNDIPIDGIVASYNDIAFSKTRGYTTHHTKDGIAFKFEDDLYESRLKCIEWTPSRFGEIAPVAVFDTIEIDGCDVSRASLHNLTFIEKLELMPGNRILVSKRNMIIPHIEENMDRGGFRLENVIPNTCPCCGQPTRIHESLTATKGEERIVRTLFCDNPFCETRKLRRFVHFVSQKAMDIEGLSEATLEKLIGQGWIHSYIDLYRLDEHRAEIVKMEGFGEKSWERLWDAIQKSRNTTFERYLIAMDIPMVGNTASRILSRQFHGSLEKFEDAVNHQYDFRQLPDFGETLHNNIHDWFCEEENRYIWEELQKMMNIEKRGDEQAVTENNVQDNPFVGLTLVMTGKVEPYTRSEINNMIESLGAHAGSSVSKKTDYLICGENAGSKLDKARSLRVTVLTPAEFFKMAV